MKCEKNAMKLTQIEIQKGFIKWINPKPIYLKVEIMELMNGYAKHPGKGLC